MKDHSDDGETIPLTVHARPKSPCKSGKTPSHQRLKPWTLAALGAGLIILSVLLVVITLVVTLRKGVHPDILQALPEAPEACSANIRAQIAFGVATSSYQVEGGVKEGGKGPNIWDTFTATPGKVAGNASGAVAVDMYHRYRQDIAMMSRLGIKYYRLSISWSRILPEGGRGVPPNMQGINYYKALLKELVAAGITPVVTLYHWDLPQELQDLYRGFLDYQLAEDFANYADLVFVHLGPYVKYWLTFNEPMSICQLGYGIGIHAPGVQEGARGQYRCGHTVLLAHAHTVQLYRQKYAEAQGGRISMAISGHWGRPFNPKKKEDVLAAKAYIEFQVAWMADPLYTGDYPSLMRQSQPDLPKFKDSEKKLLAGSLDFFSLNFYTTHFVRDAPDGAPAAQVYEEVLQDVNKKPPGNSSELFWLYDTPTGLRDMLKWVSERYKRPEIWITENGFAVKGESHMPLAQALQDTDRVQYFSGHLDNVCKAVTEDKINLSAFFAWSLMDNFEWADGYKPRFGIVYIDYANGLRRYPKLSAYWLSEHFFKHSPSKIACLEMRSCRTPAAETADG